MLRTILSENRKVQCKVKDEVGMKETSFDSSKAEQMAQLNAACRIIQEISREESKSDRKNYCITSRSADSFDMGFFKGRKFGWG